VSQPHAIAYIDGRYQVYVPQGIGRLNVGPRWLTVREAASYANALDAMPVVSPTREASDVSPRPGLRERSDAHQAERAGTGSGLVLP
jgi:hypothetical protein